MASAQPAVGEAVRRPARRRLVDGAAKPTLVFFYSPTSGACRRAEGFLAQVLQRRHNHDTFTLQRVVVEQQSDLAARLGVESAPAIVVIEAGRVRLRLEGTRGCAELTGALAPWLK
jgi:thioredoxin-like negative regulator of GroEL